MGAGSSNELLKDTDGRIRILTLNRPGDGNALTNELTVELAGELRAAEADTAISVVVLAASDPAFCTGLDRKQVAAENYKYPLLVDERRSPWKTLFSMNTPVIGAVNGPAINSGFGLALMCSFLVASEHATFGENYATIPHMHPMGGLVSLLAQTLGARRAMELSFTGETMGAEEAYRRNLVNHVVPHTELISFTLRRAEKIAQSDPHTVSMLNAIYRRASLTTLEQSYAEEELGYRERQMDLNNILQRYRDKIWSRDYVWDVDMDDFISSVGDRP